MTLSELEFLVLNNLADEPEPFSGLYVGLLDDLGALDGTGSESVGPAAVGTEDVAVALSVLCARGLAEPLGDASPEAAAISAHYADLDRELAALLADAADDDLGLTLGFAYSRGEWRFRMTEAGEVEWQRPEYAAFYPDEDESAA